MEGEKRPGSSSSSSSFTSDLFGSKDPSSASSSSSGIFDSIFSTNNPKVLGREPFRSEATEKKQGSTCQAWNTRLGHADAIIQRKEGESQNPSKKDMSSFYNEQKVQPCHLSSSIYYGGQDIYFNPQDSQSSGNSTFSKDGGEDDSGSASRGNWWKGGLYY